MSLKFPPLSGPVYWRAEPVEWWPLGGDPVLADWHARHVRNQSVSIIADTTSLFRVLDIIRAQSQQHEITHKEMTILNDLDSVSRQLCAICQLVDGALTAAGIPSGIDGPDHLPITRLAASEEVKQQRQREADEFAASGGMVERGIDGSMYCIRSKEDEENARGMPLYEAARQARYQHYGIPYIPLIDKLPPSRPPRAFIPGPQSANLHEVQQPHLLCVSTSGEFTNDSLTE